MDVEDFELAWQAITVLEARSALIDLKVADYPQAKPSDRQKLHRKLSELAFPKLEPLTPQKAVPIEELAKLLASGGR